MAWATYRSGDYRQDRVGYVSNGTLYGLKSVRQLVDLLGDDGTKLKEAAEEAKRSPREVIPLDEVRFRPLIPEPRSIRDFSSFLAHYRAGMKAIGREFNNQLLALPIFYYTNHTNMVGDGDEISTPGQCEQMDFEVEVACVIGKAGIDIDPADAEQYIAGYCVMNDWSARDILAEEIGRAPMVAKGKDAGMGLGPLLVTPDEIEDRREGKGFNLDMIASVNGKELSRGNWSSISWSFAEMIAYASRNIWLRPGEVVGAGTVSGGCLLELGATHGRDKFPWLKPGDEVMIEIERMGRMRNTVRMGKVPAPLAQRPDDA